MCEGDRYCDCTQQELMERQFGSPENVPDGIPARHVDAALRRIDKAIDEEMPTVYEADRQAVLTVRGIIREERRRLGLPAECEINGRGCER